MTPVITLVIIAVLILALALLMRRIQTGSVVALRPLRGYTGLRGQVGRAIESGSQLHITLGRASLIGDANPTSISALTVLDHVAKDGCANSTPPLVTLADGTLLTAAQASMVHSYQQAGRSADYDATATQFIATNTDAIAYSGGVASLIHQEKVTSNVMVGRFGSELGIITEAADRKQIDQVIGSDDPNALALATAVTDNLLIGEELLAAGAYLEQAPQQLASLKLQDILRWVIAAGILVTAVLSFVL